VFSLSSAFVEREVMMNVREDVDASTKDATEDVDGRARERVGVDSAFILAVAFMSIAFGLIFWFLLRHEREERRKRAREEARERASAEAELRARAAMGVVNPDGSAFLATREFV